VLLAAIDDPTVAETLAGAAARLGRFECPASIPRPYLHVSVTVVGTEVDEPDGEGEHTPEGVERIADALREALADATPFVIEFPRLDLFPSAAFCAVADSGAFERLNRAVCTIPDLPVHDRDGEGFVPHVTLGQFTGGADFEDLLGAMERDREVGAGPLRVDALELVALDLRERFPTFETVARFPLGRGSNGG
jgi:2'-5' RNA ligase